MTGVVVYVNLRTRHGTGGGEIRVPGWNVRIPFAASELTGDLTLADCLGRQVDFDYIHGAVIRIRPAWVNRPIAITMPEATIE